MTKAIITLGAAAVLLFASSAFAQKDVPGEGRAIASPPATKAEKQAARQQRLATSKEMVKKDEGRVDDKPESLGQAKSATKEEKQAARANRKVAGVQANKDDSGRLPESPTAK